MGEHIKISEAEMEVLRALWAAEDWASISEVCRRLENRGWKYKTVGTFLLRLQEKGAVESRKEGKVNLYRPLFSEEEYKHAETEQFLREVHSGSMKSLLAALCGGPVSEELLDELERRLKEE